MPKWLTLRWWLDEPLPQTDARALPWRVFDRVIRPYSLAVSLATAVVTCSVLSGAAVGTVLDEGAAQLLIGVAGAASTSLLWWGWWGRSISAMNHGLLVGAGVWAAVGAEVLLEGASWPSGLIALCWSVASAGAWLLEVNDPKEG